MADENLHLTACPECDLLMQVVPLTYPGEAADCPRCGAGLYRADQDSIERSLALVCAALALLVVANCFPIMGFNLQGQQLETTVFGAARQLWREDMPIVAALLLITTVVVPLIELSVLAWILAPLRAGRRPRGFVVLLKTLRLVEPWAMVEVFILGILVALVKLASTAEVLPGAASGCFALLMLVLAALGSVLNRRVLWQSWQAARA